MNLEVINLPMDTLYILKVRVLSLSDQSELEHVSVNLKNYSHFLNHPNSRCTFRQGLK